MSKSLADQLLKAGLVNKKQVHKARQIKQQNKPKQQSKKKQATAIDTNHAQVQQAQVEKAERDRQLNHQREAEIQRKAFAAQAKQLIESNRIAHNGPEEKQHAYHFEDAKQVKRLWVTKEAHQQITQGKLAIVKLDQCYELISKTVAEKIRERDASAVILLQKSSSATENKTDEEDPYADYQVPDDLIW